MFAKLLKLKWILENYMSQFFQTLQARVIILILMIAIPGFIGIFYDAYVEREQAIKTAISQAVNTAKTHSKIQANLIEETRE